MTAGGRAPWLEGAALALVVLVVLLAGGEAVRTSYHGYLHTTVGETVLRDGLQPENPYHAGEALRYYTLYPALGVILGRLLAGPLWAFALLNVLAALLMGPAVDAAGRGFGLSWGARRAAFLAVCLGLNALGWIGFLTGRHAPLGEAPLTVLGSMTFIPQAAGLGWDTRLQSFLPKFLNVSSFALAIPFCFWAIGEAARAGTARERSAWRSLPPAAFCLAVNPLAGAFAGAVMALCAAPTLLRGSLRQRLRWPLPGLAAGLLAAPFLLPLFSPAPEGMHLMVLGAIHGNTVSNVLGPHLLLLVPAVAGLRRLPREARCKVVIAALAVALACQAGRLPWGNEYKFSRLTGILLALPAGAWAAAWWRAGGRRRLLPLALALVALPTTALTVGAYVSWGLRTPGMPLRTEGRRLVVNRAVVDMPVPAAILEAEAAADPRAVLLMHPYAPGMQVPRALVQGNPLAPLLRHPLFVDLPHFHNDGIEDLLQRIDLAYAVWHGTSSDLGGRQPVKIAPKAALEQIRSLMAGRPLLLISPNATDFNSRLRGAGGEPLKRAAGFTLWRFPPRPAASGS